MDHTTCFACTIGPSPRRPFESLYDISRNDTAWYVCWALQTPFVLLITSCVAVVGCSCQVCFQWFCLGYDCSGARQEDRGGVCRNVAKALSVECTLKDFWLSIVPSPLPLACVVCHLSSVWMSPSLVSICQTLSLFRSHFAWSRNDRSLSLVAAICVSLEALDDFYSSSSAMLYMCWRWVCIPLT